jgi:hypothetical protein
MGLIDDISEKASDKIAEHVKKGSGSAVAQEKGPPAPPEQAPMGVAGVAGKDTPIMGQGMATQAGTEPQVRGNSPTMPSSPPGSPQRVLEGDQSQPINQPPTAPQNVAQVPIPNPVVANAVPNPSIPGATNMGGGGVIGTMPDKQVDPVKDAAKQPGFWQQAMDVATKTGKGLFELLGDFAAGYAHQASSPTQQRLAREHALRMQGNELQAQKDLLSMSQGFQQKQLTMDNEFRAKDQELAQAQASNTDENVKAQIQTQRDQLKQNYDLQTKQMKNQLEIANRQYGFEWLSRRMTSGGVDAMMGPMAGAK